MGSRRIFSRGGQIRGSEDESPPAESRRGTPVRGLGVKPPESDEKL